MTFIGGADHGAQWILIQRQAELGWASLDGPQQQMFDRIEAETAKVRGLTYGMIDWPDTEGLQLGDKINVDPISNWEVRTSKSAATGNGTMK